MKKILQTNRLYLRELTVDDAENFYLLNSDADVIKYTGDKPFESIEKARQFLENYKPYQEFGYGRWAVIDKTNEAFLGWCGLKFSSELQETDIGFRFFKKYWNQGFATESAKACIHFGFENLNLTKIVGRAMQENTASVKVLEKTGMQFVDIIDFEKHTGVLYEIESDKNQNS
jgi:ribosomal-protein-alanine N-acetyltransferase